jgi:hemoglobin-like flavoprotein
MSLNVELLEQSFARIKPNAKKFAASFYQNLFTDYPEAKPLFAKTNMDEQEDKLSKSLLLVVLNLRYPDNLKNLLKDLGERHVRYNTLEEHYPLVGSVLLKTLESYLGEDWTPEVKQAWTDAYEAIVNLMLEGAKTSSKNIQPPESSESVQELAREDRNEAEELAETSVKNNPYEIHTSESNQNLNLRNLALILIAVGLFGFLIFNLNPTQLLIVIGLFSLFLWYMWIRR